MLAKENRHERDGDIVFKEEGHRYTYLPNGKRFISVTTVIHEFFPKFNADAIIDKMMSSVKWEQNKYYPMTKEEIKKMWDMNRDSAAGDGTKMHKSIEDYFEYGVEPKEKSREFGYFMEFWKEFQKVNPEYKPFRSEWIVYDEDKELAGSIDFVLADKEGNLVLLDWKRSKEIKMSNRWQKGYGPLEGMDDCNYNHYTIQLNCYRRMLETKYGKKVVGMFLVVLHPRQDCANVIAVDVKSDEITELWKKLPLRH